MLMDVQHGQRGQPVFRQQKQQKLSHCIERLNKKYFSVILLVYNHPAILPHPYYSEGNFNILVIGRLDIQIIRNSKHGNATVTQTEFQLT